MNRFRFVPFILVATLFLGACAGGPITGKIAAVVAKPILGLAVKDAETTMEWVKTEEAAGRLSADNADLARECPQAVLDMDVLREKVAAVDDAKGFKGLIYLATKLRFGQSAKEEATFLLQRLIAACAPLVPADRLIRGF